MTLNLAELWTNVNSEIETYICQHIPFSEVEVVLQETACTIVKKFNSFINRREKTPTDFKLWVYKIATYEVYNHRRRNKQLETVPLEFFPNIISESDEIGQAFLKVLIQQLVSTINEKEKVLLEFKIYRDLTFQEISKITGENTNTLISRYNRLLNKLSTKI